jgi:hypothetical protein
MHRQNKHSFPSRGDCTHCEQSLINESSTTPQSALAACAIVVPFTAFTLDSVTWGLTGRNEFVSRLSGRSSPPPIGHPTLLSLHCALIR